MELRSGMCTLRSYHSSSIHSLAFANWWETWEHALSNRLKTMIIQVSDGKLCIILDQLHQKNLGTISLGNWMELLPMFSMMFFLDMYCEYPEDFSFGFVDFQPSQGTPRRPRSSHAPVPEFSPLAMVAVHAPDQKRSENPWCFPLYHS